MPDSKGGAVQLAPIDWVIILALFAFTLAVGVFAARRAGRDSTEFFLSGRNTGSPLNRFSVFLVCCMSAVQRRRNGALG